MSYIQEVKINSIDVTSYVTKWKVYKNKKEPDSNRAVITCNTNIFTLFNDITNLSLTVSKGDVTASNRLFTGNIHSYQYANGAVEIVGRDPFWKTRYTLVTKSYDKNVGSEAGKISAIFGDLISTYGGLTATVVDSGTLYVLDKFICNDDTVRERAKALTKVLNWQSYWDDITEAVILEPEGYTTYGTTLEVGSNVVNVPSWQTDLTNMRNWLKVKGATRRDWNTQTFVTDGALVSFDLTKTPKDTQVYLDVGAGDVLQTRGVTEASSSYDYTVDEDQKTVDYPAGSAPAAGTLTVNYSYDLAMPVINKNQSSIDLYGRQQESKLFDDIRTVDDAELRGANIISKIGLPFNKTSLMTAGIYDLTVGKKVRVVDVQQGKDLELTVQNIVYQFPEGYDMVDVGDEDFRLRDFLSNVAERIRELEKKELTNDEIIRSIFEFVYSTIYRARYFQLDKKDFSAITDEMFILGSFNFGVLGTNKLGDNSGVSYVQDYLMQGNNTYNEFFYDTDFDGTGTATWDTGNQKLSFTSGQTRTTDLLTLGVAYGFFTVTLGSSTGTITTEISGDGGSSWETVTLNTRTPFTASSVAGVKLRFTEAGATTAEIATTFNDDGSNNLPGIKLVLEE